VTRSFPTPSATIGPFFPPHYFGDGDNDLGFIDDRNKYAQGQRIYVSGRVYEANRVPRWNTVIELWQADANGCFAHPNDPRAAHADPNFMGWGRRWTENDGFFDFLTVKPGSYLDPLTGKTRAPHINVSLMSSGLMRRLVTTLFFPAEPGNAGDPAFAAVGVPEEQARLILKPAQAERAPAGALAYELDIVLQGEDETPFFID
jgi:protocatechuate 3,4-dioxygenase alpha subunit